MARTTIDYVPEGSTGFRVTITVPSGSRLSVSGDLGDAEPACSGADALRGNAALAANLWAYGKQECLGLRAPSPEDRNGHARAADRYRSISLTIADYVDAGSTHVRAGWCSACFTYAHHADVKIPRLLPAAYLCRACGSPTTPCIAPQCRNMANRGSANAQLPRYCG
jgi:hypothetical protein